MDPKKFAVILGRLLAYDGALKSRSGKQVDIAVVYHPADADSRAEASQLVSALSLLQQLRIGDLPIKIYNLPFTDSADLAKATLNAGLDVFVVCSGLEAKTAQIKQVTTGHRVLSFGRSSDQVLAGITIAIFIEDGKAAILVNLSASKAEGAVLASDLLRLARVVR